MIHKDFPHGFHRRFRHETVQILWYQQSKTYLVHTEVWMKTTLLWFKELLIPSLANTVYKTDPRRNISQSNVKIGRGHCRKMRREKQFLSLENTREMAFPPNKITFIFILSYLIMQKEWRKNPPLWSSPVTAHPCSRVPHANFISYATFWS